MALQKYGSPEPVERPANPPEGVEGVDWTGGGEFIPADVLREQGSGLPGRPDAPVSPQPPQED